MYNIGEIQNAVRIYKHALLRDGASGAGYKCISHMGAAKQSLVLLEMFSLSLTCILFSPGSSVVQANQSRPCSIL